MSRLLQAHLKKTGLSQRQFASELRISHSTVSRWISGSRAPDYPALKKLARALSVSVDAVAQDLGA